MTKTFLFMLLILSSVLFLGGCNDQVKPGHYEGNFYWEYSRTPSGDPVSLDVSYDSTLGSGRPDRGLIRISDGRDTLFTTLEITQFSKSGFDLLVPPVRPERFRLHFVKDSFADKKSKTKCYLSAPSQRDPYTAELCVDTGKLTLRVLDPSGRGVFKVMANGFTKEGVFDLEMPAQYTLDAAIKRALYGNLDSRITFEHVIQAKHTVMAAYLNLLPHLTSNLIWNAQPSYVTIVATTQGLVPFLFPTYWLNAVESQYDKKIKEDADIILRADLIAMIEQISFAQNRDQRIAALQDEVLAMAKNYQAEILKVEQTGRLKTGAAKTLDSLIEKVSTLRQSVGKLMTEERYVLSQALGFHNPEGVESIVVPDFDPSLLGDPIVKRDLGKSAKGRSFETQQTDYLRKIATLKRVELFFTWIDPTGDPKSSFGFNTISQFKLMSSQIHELDLKREQQAIAVYQNAYRVADEYNEALAGMKETLGAVQQSVGQSVGQGDQQSVGQSTDGKSQIQEVFQKSLSRKKFSPKLIKRKILKLLADETVKISNEASFRIARSKVDRLLLNGNFEYLMPHLSTEFFQSPYTGLQFHGGGTPYLGKESSDSDFGEIRVDPDSLL